MTFCECQFRRFIMNENNYYNVGDNFNLTALVTTLTQSYQVEGYRIKTVPMTSGVSIRFQKNRSVFKKLLGLSRAITVNLSTNSEGRLMVSFTDAAWAGKVFAIAVGWFLLWIPFATGIYGAYKQSELPKEINQRINAIINGYGVRI